MMRCPVCRAENDAGPNCRRCRADLSLLFQLEGRRADLLRQAQTHAARQNWPEVTRLAEHAHALRHDADAAKLVAAGWLMQGKFAQAYEWYRPPASPRG